MKLAMYTGLVVKDGRRIISGTEGICDPGIRTLVFEVAVSEHLAGSRPASDKVFVEVQLFEPADVAAVAQSAPDDVVLILSEVPTPDRMEGSRVEDAQAGRPEDATLYTVAYGGFLYEAHGEVVDLRLDLAELGPAWTDGRGSLDEMQAVVTDDARVTPAQRLRRFPGSACRRRNRCIRGRSGALFWAGIAGASRPYRHGGRAAWTGETV